MRAFILAMTLSCCAKPAAESPAPAPAEVDAATAPKKAASPKAEDEPAVIGNPENLRNNEEPVRYAVASVVEKTYAANTFKGDKQYKDKVITLLVRVKEIRPALGRPAIMSEGYGQLSRMTGGVRAILADDLIAEEQDMLAELDPGDVIALRCRGNGMAVAMPHFKDCVPWAVPTMAPVHATRAVYTCLYQLMGGGADAGVDASLKDDLRVVAEVAQERLERDGMAAVTCNIALGRKALRSRELRHMDLIFACEEEPKAPECAGFGSEANKEMRSLEEEMTKRRKKSR